MNLYEFEGKQLFIQYNIPIPQGEIWNSQISFDGPYVVKSQVLQTNRRHNGGILMASTQEELGQVATKLAKTKIKGEDPHSIYIEKREQIEQEYFLSFSFSTDTRTPILLFSTKGGTGIEDERSVNHKMSISSPSFPNLPVPEEIVRNLWKLFTEQDCYAVEINPLVKSDTGWFALDAKVVLDDTANFRHEDRTFPPRNLMGRLPTRAEQKARQVSQLDHRGAAGESYIELDGDIGVIASGGGASVVIMDTLLAHKLKPANYTEYSGNPTREKVAALSRIVLSHSLKGLLVVGGNANFTDIYETLMGVMDAVLESKMARSIPIVIRRGGPRWQEAFTELENLKDQHNLDLHLFGPDQSMTEAVKKMVDLRTQ